MANQITKIEEYVKDRIAIRADGQCFITMRGAARLLGISHTLLSSDGMVDELAEKLIMYGFDLDDHPFVDEAFEMIAEYYALDAQKTTDKAKAVYSSFADIGIRAWMHKVMGWTNSPVVEQPALPPVDIRVTNLVDALEKLGFDLNDPLLNQQLKDITGDILGLNHK